MTTRDHYAVLIGLFAIALALVGAASAATTYPALLTAYERSLLPICQTGIMAEHVRLYEALVKVADETDFGRGRNSNFAGPRTPEMAYQTCFRGGGF